MSEEILPCKRCKTLPKVVEVSGLFYVQCGGQQERLVRKKDRNGEAVGEQLVRCKCDKWNPYEFLGASRRAAIESWNYANSHKTLDIEE